VGAVGVGGGGPLAFVGLERRGVGGNITCSFLGF